MSARVLRRATWGLAAGLAALVAACSGSGSVNVVEPVITATPAPTATLAPATPVPSATSVPSATPVPSATLTSTPAANPTATNPPLPSATPTVTTSASATVAGLIVLRTDVAAGATEALGVPPTNWAPAADAAAFNRAMGSADWTIEGQVTRNGVTSADGRFAINDLLPGQYTLQVSKTLNGNLVPITIPFIVGDDGGATIVAEVGMGLVRTIVTYTQAGVLVREVRGPYGNVLITRDGRISELGDGYRTLVDANGDGSFDAGSCGLGVHAVQACDADGQCPGQLGCQCLPSCASCDDCGPGVCTIRPLPPYAALYRCSADGTCGGTADQCVCVPSCPDCNDCALSVCVPGCTPVEITAVTVNAPAQLVVGRQAQATASALLSDGSTIDVTYLAGWQSSDESVATVDSWGTVSALALGDTTLAASLGSVQGAPQPIHIVGRPTLQSIMVQNQSCFCGPVPMTDPAADASGALPPCIFNGAPTADTLPVPSCGQVVLVGATVRFAAIGAFADGSYEDITAAVQWQVTPAAVGNVVGGLFTAQAAGTAQVTASLDAVVSDPAQVRVVTQPTLDSLSIYAANVGYAAVDGGPVNGGVAIPCFGCGAALTVLRGDQLKFQATAHYDTGEWRDVTASVAWSSNDAATATIDTSGVMTAMLGGDVVIDATLSGVTSNTVDVRVVNEATLQSIVIDQEGTDRVVSKGDQRFFHATAYYDVNITRDVTADATWHSSDASVGGFDSPGVFTARAAGTVQVWAELDGQSSPSSSTEVFELTELAYCDPANINRTLWSDDFNRVTLESDCATYSEPGLATLRYTVTETQPHGGIFDPCLDLVVMQDDKLVRTIREEGCGMAFLPPNAPGAADAAVKYQLRAFWDLKDDSGAPVPAGSYVVYGRFYLYYDPVVKLAITVRSSNGPHPTRTPTPVGQPEVVVSIDAVDTIAGGQVTVGARLKAAGVMVAGVQNDIVFDPRLPIDATADGHPRCVVNPMIDKQQTTFAFLPDGCRPGIDCTTLRALILGFDNVAAIPSGALLYSCSVTVPPGAPSATYTLHCADVDASDPSGQALAAQCFDGAITIGTAMPPTPMPGTDFEGACYIGSSKCTGTSFPTAQLKCCSLFRFSAMPSTTSWCPRTQLDAAGQCAGCANTPCDGLASVP